MELNEGYILLNSVLKLLYVQMYHRYQTSSSYSTVAAQAFCFQTSQQSKNIARNS